MSNLVATSGVLLTGLAITRLTFCSRRIARQSVFGPISKKVRSLRDYSVAVFSVELNGVEWVSIIFCHDIDNCLFEFYCIFLSVIV